MLDSHKGGCPVPDPQSWSAHPWQGGHQVGADCTTAATGTLMASPINEPPLLSAVCEETRVQKSQTASHTTSQRQTQNPLSVLVASGPCPAVSAPQGGQPRTARRTRRGPTVTVSANQKA